MIHTCINTSVRENRSQFMMLIDSKIGEWVHTLIYLHLITTFNEIQYVLYKSDLIRLHQWRNTNSIHVTSEIPSVDNTPTSPLIKIQQYHSTEYNIHFTKIIQYHSINGISSILHLRYTSLPKYHQGKHISNFIIYYRFNNVKLHSIEY